MDIEENVHNKLETIKKRDGEIRAFIDVDGGGAIQRAREVDKKMKKGTAGKLAGMVIAVKNIIAIEGKRLTCSSMMLQNYIAPYNATVIEKILREDAVIIGTTNLDEFACGSDTTHSAFFPTRNPIDTSRVPGGSSGGSAAAVAGGMADAALGSDTGGSIRCPGAFCGIVGFKPTYGAVSRYGLADMAMSLDQIGPLAPDVETTKRLYDVIKGKDPKDPITENFRENKKAVRKIGVPKQFFEGIDGKISDVVKRRIKQLEKKFEVVEVSIPSVKYAIPVYYLLMAAEFSSAMQKYDGLRYGAGADRKEELYSSYEKVRGKNLGAEVKRRILLGTYITTKEYRDAWYTKTLRARKVLQNEFKKILGDVDAIVGPAMPVLPWRFGEKLDPVEMYSADILTVSANLAGVPAGVVPIGKIDGLPVAMQIHGGHFNDTAILDFMGTVEKMSKD